MGKIRWKKSSKREWGVILDRYYVFWTTFQPSPPTNYFTVFFLTICHEKKPKFCYIFLRGKTCCTIFDCLRFCLILIYENTLNIIKKAYSCRKHTGREEQLFKANIFGGWGVKLYSTSDLFLIWSICLQHALFAKC